MMTPKKVDYLIEETKKELNKRIDEQFSKSEGSTKELRGYIQTLHTEILQSVSIVKKLRDSKPPSNEMVANMTLEIAAIKRVVNELQKSSQSQMNRASKTVINLGDFAERDLGNAYGYHSLYQNAESLETTHSPKRLTGADWQAISTPNYGPSELMRPSTTEFDRDEKSFRVPQEETVSNNAQKRGKSSQLKSNVASKNF